MPILKILLVFGTRPEVLKLAPLVSYLKSSPQFKAISCSSGQHESMLQQALATFDMQPDINLNVMKANQDLFDVTSGVLLGLRDVLRREKPDMMVVQGDTTTTVASALAAFYERIPVGHVEAGLRTWDYKLPYPEEMNRVLVSRLACVHFCPTLKNRDNLLKEGIANSSIFMTGNTIVDTFQFAQEKAKSLSEDKLKNSFGEAFDSIVNSKKRIVLITSHRREAFGEGLASICKAIQRLASTFKDTDFIYPAHLNPNVIIPVKEMLSGYKNIYILPPLDYLSMIYLMSRAYLVLTDSGGIQEEAPSVPVPLLVMRDATERTEVIEAGMAELVGTQEENIYLSASRILASREARDKMLSGDNPYGDGTASEKIAECILSCFKHGQFSKNIDAA